MNMSFLKKTGVILALSLALVFSAEGQEYPCGSSIAEAQGVYAAEDTDEPAQATLGKDKTALGEDTQLAGSSSDNIINKIWEALLVLLIVIGFLIEFLIRGIIFGSRKTKKESARSNKDSEWKQKVDALTQELDSALAERDQALHAKEEAKRLAEKERTARERMGKVTIFWKN